MDNVRRCSLPFLIPRRIAQHKEASMRRLALLAGVAVYILALQITPSWGQPVCAAPGCNPTTSDLAQNTAGGTGALGNVIPAVFPCGRKIPPWPGCWNTAFG